jgi:hypothetical protein
MSYEMLGKLYAKFDTVQRSESFKTREFVIEKSEEGGGRTFTSYIKFQCVQDKTSMPDKFNIGDDVKVQFNIKGTRWEKDGRVNFITNLDAWRMETMKMNADAGSDGSYTDAPAPGEVVDDLPF